MKVVWVLVAIVACAPARPEKLEAPQPVWHRSVKGFAPSPQPTVQLAPPPAIDLSPFMPDFHDELRWPLTPMNHPVMEPKFPIAQEFAQPGVGWMELCSSGVTNRFGGDKELLSYLRGWCKAVEGDTDAACTNLAPLMHSTKPRLEAAVRNDLANILAQNHADKAEHFIQAHQLRDVGMLDLLAANFVEVGTTDDALTINRSAIDSDDYPAAATKCMRWTRQIVLLGDKLSPLMKQIEAYATVPNSPDPTCVTEYNRLRCWAGDCAGLMRANGASPFDEELIEIVELWATTRSSKEWWTIAGKAAIFLSMKHTSVLADSQIAEVATASMENATRLEIADTGTCATSSPLTIVKYRGMLHPFADAALDARLQALEKACP